MLISDMMVKVNLDVPLLLRVLLVLRGLQESLGMAQTVYFDSYRDCLTSDSGSFHLDDTAYDLRAVGDPEIHETKICNMKFRAPQDTGICLTIQGFRMDDCDMFLAIYQSSDASGRQWKKLTCENNGHLPQLCTPERYVSLKLYKNRLNHNRGYNFKIFVEKSSNLTGEDVILASSIGLFVGIIAGVVVLIVILAGFVMYCCCKPCRAKYQQERQMQDQQRQQQQMQQQLEQCIVPSAPPETEVDMELTPLQQGGVDGLPLYPNLLPQHPHYPGGMGYGIPEPPPPYAPPPYEEHIHPTKG